MKILALGDPHGKLPKNLSSIIKKEGIELLICTGDHGDAPQKPWLEEEWKRFEKQGRNVYKSTEEIFKELCSYKVPVLTLQGNMMLSGKGIQMMRKIYRKYKNLYHKNTGKLNLKGKTFIFFDVIWEENSINKDANKRSKEFTRERMKRNPKREERLNQLLRENPNAILLTHNPPYGKVDTAWNNKHVGSKIILNAIKKHKPNLVLCGHIHEAKGKAKIGKSEVYNLGSHGDYKIFNI